MYGDQGRTRVALADPVGEEEKFEGLYWRFAEQAHDEGMRAAFYQVGAAMVPTCVEMGLRVFKLGEEAMVPLDTFDLDSSGLKRFRKVLNRMEREAWQFQIWQPAEVATRIGELRAISAAWLVHHQGGEKGFSLGRFDEAYLCRLPVAVIIVNGRAVAFGNVWPGNGKSELSTDLMRHFPAAPGERSRYGISSSDLLGLPATGPDSFALADLAPALHGVRIAQFAAGLDPLDSAAWLDALDPRSPHKLIMIPSVPHDMGLAGARFLAELDMAIQWMLDTNSRN
jgi:phosphatidylglycerol lysyltransferase